MRAIRPRTGLNQALSTVYPRVYTRGSPKRNFVNFAWLINISTENKATNGSDYRTFRAGARTGSGASPSAAETAAIQRGGGAILRNRFLEASAASDRRAGRFPIVSVSFPLAPLSGSKRKRVFDDVPFYLFRIPWVKTHG